MPAPWELPPTEPKYEQICIVDDDEWVADSLKLLLEAFGFEVRSYSSAADLLADRRRRTARCLIIDQHMPGMDGLDLLERLQKEGVRAPAILISGRLDTNTKERAARLGITSVFEKPFAADRLVDAVRTVMSERN